LEASVAAVHGTDPLAPKVVEIVIISIAYTVLNPAEMVNVFTDGESSVLGELEDELIEGLPVCGAFTGFPVDYESGEIGESEGASAGDRAGLVDFLMLADG
jgi:hypothetical protein